MIKIAKYKNKITIEGHANYAPMGRDVVCAGISVLLQTLIHSIETLADDKIEYNLEPGNAYLAYQDLSTDSKLLIRSFLIGSKDIAYTFPEHVAVFDDDRSNGTD